MRTIEQNSLGLDVAYIKLEKGYTLADDKPIRTHYDAVYAVADMLKELDREVVCLITLKNNNVPINASIVSVGTANAAMVFPRDVMKTAILSNAVKIILLHNHPSGGAIPSVDDIRLTDRLKRCCELMDIQFLDHIIIGATSKEWFSFSEKQLLNPSDIKYKETLQTVDLKKSNNSIENNPALPISMTAESNGTYKKHKGR